jgi:hypothetical protein
VSVDSVAADSARDDSPLVPVLGKTDCQTRHEGVGVNVVLLVVGVVFLGEVALDLPLIHRHRKAHG